MLPIRTVWKLISNSNIDSNSKPANAYEPIGYIIALSIDRDRTTKTDNTVFVAAS